VVAPGRGRLSSDGSIATTAVQALRSGTSPLLSGTAEVSSPSPPEHATESYIDAGTTFALRRNRTP